MAFVINWDPVTHLGPIPINRYGIGWASAFLVGLWLIRRWAPPYGMPRHELDDPFLRIVIAVPAWIVLVARAQRQEEPA